MSSQSVRKLTAPVAGLAFLLLVIAIGSAWYVQNLQRSMSELVANNVASVQAAQELEISVRDTRKQFDRYLITLDESHLKPIPNLKQRTLDALVEAEQLATTPAELALMKRARAGYFQFFAEYERIVREREQWKYSKIIELMDTVLLREILEPAHEYLRLNEGMLTRATKSNRELTDRLTFGLIALGLCGACGGMLGGSLIASTVRRSIEQTEERVRITAAELEQAAHGSRSRSNTPIKSIDPLEQMQTSAQAVLNRLKETERAALRAEQLAWVGQMAAGIAHEVRNPLMAIKLLVQATAERHGKRLFKDRDLEVLEEEIMRLELIVSGFLDFARPPQPQPRMVDLGELVDRTVESLRPRADLQGVVLDVEPARQVLQVSADPNQVRQVLLNLVINALEAQPTGGKIAIRYRMDESTADRPDLTVVVEDNGPGVAPELINQVFDPFVSTKESGLGLGLSICRRIAEIHGGSLTLESSPTGAQFLFRLPLQVSVPKAIC